MTKKQLLIYYAGWCILHIYFFLSGDPYSTAGARFWPFDGELRYYYDLSELFVYVALPPLIYFLKTEVIDKGGKK